MPALLFALLVPDAAAGRTLRLRDRVADATAVTLALAYGALMVSVGDATASGAALPWPVDCAIGVICAVALVVRRRWPVGLALALIPFSAVSVMATGAVTITLATVAVRRAGRVALLLSVANIAAGALYFLLQPDPRFPIWVDVVVRAAISVAATGWGLFVQAHRKLTMSLREHAARLEREQEMRVDQARLTERTRIAREMHDVLAHRLSLLSLHAGALEVRTDASAREVSVAAATIRTSAHQALQDLRSVIQVLRTRASTTPGSNLPADSSPELPQPGLVDIPDLVGTSRAHGLTVEYRCLVAPHGPPASTGRTVYRIVQEGLTNAGKHAPGEAVQVRIDGSPGQELRVRVLNRCYDHTTPAPGPAAVPGSGVGLVGIQERVTLAGGRVTYGREPAHDHGPATRFRLEAWLPWPG